MKTAQIDPSVYDAAHKSVVLVDRSNLGMLKISGKSRLDLINRMSTQAVNNLKSGEGAATILTTDIGRMIDRLILYAASESVYALTGENHGDEIARYLMRFVFFNDDFHLQDISADTSIFGVYGPQAAEILDKVTGFPVVDIPLHHWREVEIAGESVYLHRTDPLNGCGYFVICDSAQANVLKETLSAVGLVYADEAAFDLLRIEAGQPRFGFEITQEYIPLEAGLWDDVSFNKGCYTGQEIIARMESRGKLAKQLIKLAAGGLLQAGEEIKSGDKVVGTITSTAAAEEGALALGYVKSTALEGSEPLVSGGEILRRV